MKELQSAARNISAIPRPEGGFRPMVEAIIIVSEPRYSLDEAGNQFRQRVIDTLRFSTTPEGLRALGKIFGEWADEAEREVGEAIKNADSDGVVK